jgi:hypothetical protein
LGSARPAFITLLSISVIATGMFVGTRHARSVGAASSLRADMIFGRDRRWRSRNPVGRPKVSAELRTLIGEMSRANPLWGAPQITEAYPWDHAPRYLIRDRDTSYGPVFVQRLRAMGIRDRPIAFRSPWQNAYVERLIGSIRRECLDHMIVFGEAHLRRILGAYAAYYNESRTHRSLNKDAPFHRAIERLGAITSHPILGGLHHQYCRI